PALIGVVSNACVSTVTTPVSCCTSVGTNPFQTRAGLAVYGKQTYVNSARKSTKQTPCETRLTGDEDQEGPIRFRSLRIGPGLALSGLVSSRAGTSHVKLRTSRPAGGRTVPFLV